MLAALRSATAEQAELWQGAAAIAAQLPVAQPGSRIAFAFGTDRRSFATALLGTWLAGHIAALPETARREHVAPILGMPGVVGFLHDTEVGRGLFVPQLLREAGRFAVPESPPTAPDRVLLATFTHQLHGGVRERLWTSASLLNTVDELVRLMQLAPGVEVVCALAPTYEVAVLAGLLAPLRSGATLHRELPRQGEPLPALDAGSNPTGPRQTVAIVPPIRLAELAARSRNQLAALRRVLCTDDPWPMTLAELRTGQGIDVVTLPQDLGAPPADEVAFAATRSLRGLAGVHDAVVVIVEATAMVAIAAPDGQLAEFRVAAHELLPSHLVPMVRTLLRLPRDENGRIEPAALFLQFGRGRDGRAVVRDLQWTAVDAAPGEHRFRTVVPTRYVFFEGHFTPYPVLAGAVQLQQLVLPCLRRTHPQLGAATRVANVKFLARIAPGDAVEVTIRATAKVDQIDFEIHCGTTRCTAGRLGFASAGAASP